MSQHEPKLRIRARRPGTIDVELSGITEAEARTAYELCGNEGLIGLEREGWLEISVGLHGWRVAPRSLSGSSCGEARVRVTVNLPPEEVSRVIVRSRRFDLLEHATGPIPVRMTAEEAAALEAHLRMEPEHPPDGEIPPGPSVLYGIEEDGSE